MGKSGWPLQEEDNKDPYFFRYSLKAALTCLTIEHSNFQYKHAGLIYDNTIRNDHIIGLEYSEYYYIKYSQSIWISSNCHEIYTEVPQRETKKQELNCNLGITSMTNCYELVHTATINFIIDMTHIIWVMVYNLFTSVVYNKAPQAQAEVRIEVHTVL